MFHTWVEWHITPVEHPELKENGSYGALATSRVEEGADKGSIDTVLEKKVQWFQ